MYKCKLFNVDNIIVFKESFQFIGYNLFTDEQFVIFDNIYSAPRIEEKEVTIKWTKETENNNYCNLQISLQVGPTPTFYHAEC